MLEILAQTKTGTSNLASTVVAFDNNTIGGNSIIVISGNSSSTAGDVSGVTDTQGNVYTKVNATANATVGEIEIWYSSGIIGGADTVTVAYTTGVACAVIIREYNGLIYANSLDKQTGTTGNSNTLSSGNTGTLAQNSELLVGAGLIPLANSFTAGGNYVNLVSAGAPLVIAVAAEDLLVTTGGVQAAIFGANASIQWVCVIATFFLLPTGTTTSTSSTSTSSTSTSSTSTSMSSTSSSSSTSSTSASTVSTSSSSTSSSISTSSTSTSYSITTVSTSSTSSSISSTSISSTSNSTSISSTSSSISSTSISSTSTSSTSSSTSISSTSTSFSSTSSSISSTSHSTSSTSLSSTSSSSSTSTTTIPINLTYSYEDRASVTTVQSFIKTGTWVCPANVTSVLAECWGGGAGGGANASGGGGGGGGAYSNSTVAVSAGTSYTVTVGSGGASAVSGGDSWFSSTGTVLAKGGTTAGSSTTGAAGGAAGSGVGTVTSSGGTGGSGSAGAGGGGGGGAGTSTGGTGVAGGAGGGGGGVLGGIGGAGGPNASNGSPGKAIGGGGGGDGATGVAGAGAGGYVQLTFTTIVNPTTNTNLLNSFTNPQVDDVNGDDGDYFIEYGSEFMAREYKKKWINNTDNLVFTWRGRTTLSTLRSPMLIQIYNVNSTSWETLAVANTVLADTDFSATVTQTTNVSNYYDANNIVTFRSYQQVF